MKTVGQILKNTRLEKKITLKQAAAATKIREEFLKSLEEDDFSKLPSYVAQGFLKNYAQFLGISPKLILAIFRRDFVQKETKQNWEKAKRGLYWSPRITVILVSILVFFGLSFWLGYQYFSLKKPPFLEIISPVEGEKVFGEKIEVRGRTQKDALLTINDLPVALSSQGDFSYQLDLFLGENKIVIVAKNREGKETKIERTVFRLDK